jgi:4-hydroxy-tetrahydrodipicolinate synthase
MSATNRFNLRDFPLWTALITPFTHNGDVDYDDLLTLLKAQEEAGNGIVLLGSTGEALNLDLATKQAIIEFCCEQNLNVPLMVGVGGTMLKDTLDWIGWLNQKPIHALMMVTPLYSKPGYHGQKAWFKALLDAANVPCVLYNVPGRTAVSLDFNTVNDLLHHENFYGIKEASGEVDSFKAYCRAAPGKVMFCGDDALMPEFTRAGAHGLISVVSNVWPRATHLYVKQNLNSTFLDISVWRKACNALMCVSNPIPVKRLLNAKEVIKSAFLQPPLHANDLTDVMPLIQQDQAIKDWYMQNTKYSKRIS